MLLGGPECRGTLKVGFTQSEVLGVLGQPDGKSEDGSVLRFGDRYLKFAGFADYLLYVDGKAAGVIEAKMAGVPLISVEWQRSRP